MNVTLLYSAKDSALSIHIGRAPFNSNLKLRITKRLKV